MQQGKERGVKKRNVQYVRERGQLPAVSHPSFLLWISQGATSYYRAVYNVYQVIQTSLYASSTMCVSMFGVTLYADDTDGKFLLHMLCLVAKLIPNYFYFYLLFFCTFNSAAHWSALVDQQTRMHASLQACDASGLRLTCAPSPSPSLFYPPYVSCLIKRGNGLICAEVISKNLSTSERTRRPR